MGQVKTTIKIVDKASSQLDKISESVNGLQAAFDKLESVDSRLNNVEKEVRDIGNAANSSAKQTNLLISKLRRLASTYLGVMGTGAMINTADTMTSANNKFVTYGTNAGMDIGAAEQFSAETLDKIFAAAQDSFSGYTSMMNNVAKSVTLAGDAFGDTSEQQVNNAIKFQEIMAKAYAISGASAQEMSSSMYQLVQALSSGVLQGDELRSVREGAPLAAKAIEDFAQEVLGSTKSLKELGSEGLITSDMVVAAVLNMEGETEKAFEYIRKNMTFSQMWTQFKNDAVNAFRPFLETLREIGNNQAFQAFIQSLTDALYVIGAVVNWVAVQFNNAFTWIYNNWSMLQPLFNALTGIILVLAGVAIANLISKLWTMLAAFVANHATLLVYLALIGALIYYFSIVGISCETLATALLVLAGVALIAGIIMGSPFYIVMGLILLLAGLFFAFTEHFMAGVYAIGAVLFNVVGAAWELILGFIEVIWNAWAMFANFLGNLFNDPIAAIIGVFLDLADIVLGVLESIASAIDFIFGSNMAGTISSWRSGMNSWYNKTFTPEVFVEDFDKSQLQFDRWSYADAIGEGYQVGGDLKNSIEVGLDNIIPGVTDFFGNAIGGLMDNYGSLQIPQSTIGAGDYGIDTPTSSALDDIGKGVGGIGKDTSDISKSMDLTEEDLKYLRQIAEMEAINKFTTAEIRVEMNNSNQINGTTDLDGIVTHLKNTLTEELQVLANGVHYA